MNASGVGTATGVVTVQPGWGDIDGDINGVVKVIANIVVKGRFTLTSEGFTLK